MNDSNEYKNDSNEYKNGGRGAWAHVASDKEKRTRRVRRPDLFQYRTEAPVNFAPSGTALVLFAREGHERLMRIRQALAQGDSALLERLASDLALYFGAREPSPVATPLEGAELLSEEPVYAELRYESKVVVPVMAAPERNPLGGMLIPYIGGPLYPDGFTYEEYLSSPEGPGIEVIVIASEPKLSPLEQAMVKRAAESETGMVIGTGGYGIWPAVIVQVVIMTVTGTLCVAGNDEMAAIKLKENELSNVDPSASALKLLSLREQVILRHM